MPRPPIDYEPHIEAIIQWQSQGFSNDQIVDELRNHRLSNASVRTLKRRLARYSITRRDPTSHSTNAINCGLLIPAISTWIQSGLTDSEIVGALSDAGFIQASERTLQRCFYDNNLGRRVYLADRIETRVEIAVLWAKQFFDLEIAAIFKDQGVPIALRTMQRLRRSMDCLDRMTKEQ